MTIPTTSQRAQDALRSSEANVLWAALKSDGFVVDVNTDGNVVIIDVQAGDAPCAECLVPTSTICGIVLMFLEEHGIDVGGLAIDVRLPDYD